MQTSERLNRNCTNERRLSIWNLLCLAKMTTCADHSITS